MIVKLMLKVVFFGRVVNMLLIKAKVMLRRVLKDGAVNRSARNRK